jgi:CheY-like chemotaxis protein
MSDLPPRSPEPPFASSDVPPLADRLLLVEDCEEDVFLFRRLLGVVNRHVPLDVVTDGESAVQWLAEKIAEARAGRAVLPRTIFVDLKLPGMHGMEVLRWIRAEPAFDGALVAVCSASAEQSDISEASALHASAYVKKYPPADQLAALLAARDPHALPRELSGYGPAR